MAGKKSIIIVGGKKKTLENPPKDDIDFNIQKFADIDVVKSRGNKKPLEIESDSQRDVIKVELENGQHLFSRRDDLEDYVNDTSRSASSDTLHFEQINLGSTSRGGGELLVKAIEMFKLQDPLVEFSAMKICELFENKSIKTFGLIKINGESGNNPAILSKSKTKPTDDTKKPILVFLHGTASHTQGSFGELLKDREFRKRLNDNYAAVYGFDHRTLTQSPIENAIELATALPDNATLHFVSHSRGGLVGELLCRATKVKGDPISKAEIHNFNEFIENLAKEQEDESVKKNFKEQSAALKDLNTILKTKRFTVERFVRVACPSRGTTLASGRLDRWFSRVFSLLNMIPPVKASTLFSLFEKLVVALVETRTKPNVIPGLEAQMPGSPTIFLLNNNQQALNADLTVISGDAEDKNLFWKIGLFVADKFFAGDNDLVVNTPSMYGGGLRKKQARHFLDSGKSVTHFNYFLNKESAVRVVDGLLGSEATLNSNFKSVLPKLALPIARSVNNEKESKPIVYLLPGILGSELDVENKNIWINKKQLLLGGIKKLEIDDLNVHSTNLVDFAYANLIEYLSINYTVKPFHFDWRLPITQEAKRLADSVKESIRITNHKTPISIIAHSMGGLVARMMIASHRTVWKQMLVNKKSRLIMLGTPNDGSYAIPRVLTGQDILVKALAAVDFKTDINELLSIISHYPGMLNLLPSPDSKIDLFSHEQWKKLEKVGRGKFPIPKKQDLEQARAVRDQLNTVVFKDEPQGQVLYVAGKANRTPTAISTEKNRIKFKGTEQGDGRVPWKTGIPEGIPVWYMDVKHGSLANYSPGFQAFEDLLQKGTTELLSKQPPHRTRGIPEEFDMPEDEVEFLPDENDLRDFAVGSSSASVIASKLSNVDSKIKVSVTHGDLIFSRNPVMVGHYFNDSICSAEQALDKRLKGKLSSRHELGLYPGKLNTNEVIYDSDLRPEGAVIIGLGDIGDLTKASLTNSFSKALKEYALHRYELINSANVHKLASKSEIGISTIIIGSSDGGLPCIDCIQAMLEGIFNANQALKNHFKDDLISITELEIFELWEDIAIHSVKQLLDLKGLISKINNKIVLNPHLQEGEGRRYRSNYKDDAPWWQHLQIRETDENHLTFKTISDRARNEYRIMPNDRAKVNRFIETATQNVALKQGVSKTLFEMLWPNELKNNASSMGDTVLLLNEASARYPWELLHDRWGESEFPMAVDFKMIRQLESKLFTENPVVSSTNNALVVGAPNLSDAWPKLRGAIKEARLVENLLKGPFDFSTTELIERDGFEILDAIYSESYRILHLAGHGVYEHQLDSEQKKCLDCGQGVKSQITQSGMVIADDMLLTPADVEKMRHVPELVFINCCYLGEIENIVTNQNFPAIADNLSTQFIRKGSKAVIAAGWEVQDDAALTFARVFYTSMLKGNDFGGAVKLARYETYLAHDSFNTWGAYQCYGDPTYKLIDCKSCNESNNAGIVSATEIINDLKSLASEAKTFTNDDSKITTSIEAKKEYLCSNAPSWLDRGDVCAALGEAFKEVRQFDSAVKWYSKSLACETATVSIQATEQLANILIRRSVEKLSEDKISDEDKFKIIKNIEQATDYLHNLTSMFKQGDYASTVTKERLSLLGSAYKRKAMVSKLEFQNGPGITDVDYRNQISNDLKKSQKFFNLATKLNNNAKVIVDEENKELNVESLPINSNLPKSYPYLNYITVKHLRYLMYTTTEINKNNLDVDISKDEKEILIKLAKNYDEAERLESNFWNLAAVADGKLVDYLIQGKLTNKKNNAALLDIYIKAFDRAVSPIQFSSVQENLEFICLMVDPTIKVKNRSKTKIRRLMHENLEAIISKLKKLNSE